MAMDAMRQHARVTVADLEIEAHAFSYCCRVSIGPKILLS